MSVLARNLNLQSPVVECSCLREKKLCNNCQSLARWLYELFRTRSDVYAIQCRDENEPDSSKQYKYRPIHEPVTPEVIEDHLRGKHTVGFYALDAMSKAHWICFDLDTDDPQRTLRILKAITKHGILPESVLVENSGAKGRHIWIMTEPSPAAIARKVGQDILIGAGLEHADKIEIFPKQDTLTPDAPLGNFVKLPMGKHLKTGQRAMLVDGSSLQIINWTDAHEKLEGVVPTSLENIKLENVSSAITATQPILPECATTIPVGIRDYYLFSLLNALKQKYPDASEVSVRQLLEPVRERSDASVTKLDEKVKRIIGRGKSRFPIFTLCKYGKAAGTCPYQIKEYCTWVTDFTKKPPIELSDYGREFLIRKDLHERTADILDTVIYGERQLKMLVHYLCLGCAIHDNPSGIIIIDRLGGGKSHCEREVVSLYPKERVEQPTSFTEHALNYLAENFAGKIVRIDEIFGVEDVLKDIRVWMTNGRLERVSSPVSDQEKSADKAVRRITEGCPVFATSTTRAVEEELGSRNWFAHVDVSADQSAGIHARQIVSDMVPSYVFQVEDDVRQFLTGVIAWVLENVKPVLIPYAFTFPIDDPRTRRDRGRFQALIKDIANWHQLQREVYQAPEGQEYIIATSQDFEIALQIAKPYLLESLTSLDTKAIQVLRTLLNSSEALAIRDIAQKTGVSYHTVRKRIEDLLTKGHATSAETGRPEKFAPTAKARKFGEDVSIEIICEDEGRRFIEKLKAATSPEQLRDEIHKFEKQLKDVLLSLHASSDSKRDDDSRSRAVETSKNNNSEAVSDTNDISTLSDFSATQVDETVSEGEQDDE